MISVRLYKFKNPDCADVSITKAIEHFEGYYEDVCDTPYGMRFDTMACCLLHTQKKPRQLIGIFNAWLFLETKYPEKTRMELINDAVHFNQTLMIKGVFDVYVDMNIQIYDIFMRVFSGSKYCFSESEFDKMIKNASNLRDTLDAYELKKIFLSCGLVGVFQEFHYIRANNHFFKNVEEKRIKEVAFEYQIKDRLPINNRCKFVLHPMCYQTFNIDVDKNTFVYPMPADEDEFIPWDIYHLE
jgi:hypothetical protein